MAVVTSENHSNRGSDDGARDGRAAASLVFEPLGGASDASRVNSALNRSRPPPGENDSVPLHGGRGGGRAGRLNEEVRSAAGKSLIAPAWHLSSSGSGHRPDSSKVSAPADQCRGSVVAAVGRNDVEFDVNTSTTQPPPGAPPLMQRDAVVMLQALDWLTAENGRTGSTGTSREARKRR